MHSIIQGGSIRYFFSLTKEVFILASSAIRATNFHILEHLCAPSSISFFQAASHRRLAHRQWSQSAEIALHLLDLFFSHTVLSKSDVVFGVVIFSLSLQPKQLLQRSFQVMPSQHSTTTVKQGGLKYIKMVQIFGKFTDNYTFK